MSQQVLFHRDLNKEEEPEGPDVLFLQTLLMALNLAGQKMKLSGKYDHATAEAMERLQKYLGFQGTEINGNLDQKIREAIKRVYHIDMDNILLQ